MKKEQDCKKKEPRQTNYLWVLAGAYLLYLAFQNAKTLIRGENSFSTVLSIIMTVLFAVVGIWLILREWHVYRHGDSKTSFLEKNEEVDAHE